MTADKIVLLIGSHIKVDATKRDKASGYFIVTLNPEEWRTSARTILGKAQT
jgi:hypothetical protein